MHLSHVKHGCGVVFNFKDCRICQFVPYVKVWLGAHSERIRQYDWENEVDKESSYFGIIGWCRWHPSWVNVVASPVLAICSLLSQQAVSWALSSLCKHCPSYLIAQILPASPTALKNNTRLAKQLPKAPRFLVLLLRPLACCCSSCSSNHSTSLSTASHHTSGSGSTLQTPSSWLYPRQEVPTRSPLLPLLLIRVRLQGSHNHSPILCLPSEQPSGNLPTDLAGHAGSPLCTCTRRARNTLH